MLEEEFGTWWCDSDQRALMSVPSTCIQEDFLFNECCWFMTTDMCLWIFVQAYCLNLAGVNVMYISWWWFVYGCQAYLAIIAIQMPGFSGFVVMVKDLVSDEFCFVTNVYDQGTLRVNALWITTLYCLQMRCHSWLRHYATSRKVAGSIPIGVIGIFHWHNPSSHTMALGVNSASNRNEYQEYFLGGKGGRCVALTTLPPSCASCLEIWEPQPPGTLRACPGL